MANDVQFTWTREAGTFRFTGSFDQGRGSGTYTFTPDQAFVSNMANAGYRNLSTDDIVRLAVIDVTMAHVRGLAQAGYPNLPLDDSDPHAHSQGDARVRARPRRRRLQEHRRRGSGRDGHPWRDAGQHQGAAGCRAFAARAVEELIRFRIHKVTPEFIKAMEARGYKNVPAEDLVKMRIHKVSPRRWIS